MADDPRSIAKSLTDLVDHLKMQKEATEKIGDVVERGIEKSEKDGLKTKEAEQERQNLLKRMFTSIDESMSGLKDSLAKPFEASGSLFGKLLGGLVGIGTAVLAPVFTFFGKSGPIGRLVTRILSIGEKIAPFLGPGGKIASIFSKFLGPLAALVSFSIGAWEGWSSSDESDFGLRIIDALQGGISQLLSSLTFGFASYDMISEFVDPFFSKIKSFFTNVSSIITDPNTGWIEKVGLLFDELWFNIKEAFTWWYGMIWDATVASFNAIAGFFADPIPMVMGAWNAVTDAFTMVGEWIFENMKRPKFAWISDAAGEMGREYREAAMREVQSRRQMQKAYEDTLEQQKEEEFQENLDAQRKRLERIRRSGADEAAYQREIERLDRRFEDADQAARAREALGREGLLTVSNELAENRARMTLGGQPTTNLVPVTTTANVQNNTFTQSPIEPRKRNYGGREMVPAF